MGQAVRLISTDPNLRVTIPPKVPIGHHWYHSGTGIVHVLTPAEGCDLKQLHPDPSKPGVLIAVVRCDWGVQLHVFSGDSVSGMLKEDDLEKLSDPNKALIDRLLQQDLESRTKVLPVRGAADQSGGKARNISDEPIGH